MMIVLDTNVLSELLRSAPSQVVIGWFAFHPKSGLFTTAITQAEILAGIALMPDGRRKSGLSEGARRVLDETLAGRILAFDTAAATAYGQIIAARRKVDRPIEPLDAQIAAIAASHGAAIATRNVADFDHCGVAIINPWAG